MVLLISFLFSLSEKLTILNQIECSRVLVLLFLFIPVNFFHLCFLLSSSICLVFSPAFSKQFLSVTKSAGKLACKRLSSSVSIQCTTFFDSSLSNSIRPLSACFNISFHRDKKLIDFGVIPGFFMIRKPNGVTSHNIYMV